MPIHFVHLVGLLLLGMTLECFWPLRRAARSKSKRIIINLTLAAFSALVLRATVSPLVVSAALAAGVRRWGLLGHLSLSDFWSISLGILILDYTLYLWHRLNHGPAIFWRFIA